MNLNINFAPEVKAALEQEAQATGQDVGAVIAAIVAEKFAGSTPPRRRLSHEEFKRRLREIAESFPGSGGHVDDSRESIYEGRGE